MGHDLACIITVPLDWDLEPNWKFIHECKTAATRLGCPLIFDDVFSGFRLHMQGGEGFFRIKSDLVCLSKAIANGYPLAAVVGQRDIMSSAVRTSMSSTYSTDRLSLTAGIETMKRIYQLDPPLHDHFSMLYRAAEAEIDGCLRHLSRDAVFFGQPAAPRFKFVNSSISPLAVRQEAAKRGILFNGTYLFTYSHTEEEAIRGVRIAGEVLAELLQRAASQPQA
jgi:glutamate-1-semialdehyde aminotransferase